MLKFTFQSPLGDLVNGNLALRKRSDGSFFMFQSPLGDLVNGNLIFFDVHEWHGKFQSPLGDLVNGNFTSAVAILPLPSSGFSPR